MSKILLHSCCGPCTTYVNQWLADNAFEVKSLFYNPNIRPIEEYERRLLTMEHYATIVGLKVIFEPNELELIPGNCEDCYRVRLKKTAQKAKELNFDSFTTTLLVSPYQKHELLKEIGQAAGQEAGIEFFYHDFRAGFRQGQNMAKELKLYRQKYCGCGIDLKVKEKVYAKVS